MARFGTRMASGDGPGVIDYGAVSMGYRYPSMAGDDLTPLLPRELAGQPGTRAPHVPITLSGRAMSTLDLYGAGLVLLAGPAGESWVAAAGNSTCPSTAMCSAPTSVPCMGSGTTERLWSGRMDSWPGGQALAHPIQSRR
jgi:hypothetical protein